MIDEQEAVLVISYGNDIDNLPGTLPEEKVKRLLCFWFLIIVTDSSFHPERKVMSLYRKTGEALAT